MDNGSVILNYAHLDKAQKLISPIGLQLQCFWLNLFAEQGKRLSKVNTMTQIVVQARLLLMKKKAESSSDHIT